MKNKNKQKKKKKNTKSKILLQLVKNIKMQKIYLRVNKKKKLFMVKDIIKNINIHIYLVVNDLIMKKIKLKKKLKE